MKVSKQAGDGDTALGCWMMTRSHVALALAGSLRLSQIAFEQRVLLLVTTVLVDAVVRLACNNSSLVYG